MESFIDYGTVCNAEKGSLALFTQPQKFGLGQRSSWGGGERRALAAAVGPRRGRGRGCSARLDRLAPLLLGNACAVLQSLSARLEVLEKNVETE
jgi:hypothetical protein